MVDCRISHNTSETLNENIMQYIDHDNGGLLMRKVIACFLTIALVLFAFTACENKTSTPDVGETTIPDPGTTTAPKATTEQLFLLQELYRQSFLNMDVTTDGVSLDNDVYTFRDVDIDDAYNDFKGTLSGTFKNSKTEVSINVSFKSVGDKIYTVSGTIERNGKDAEITVNGEKCLIHKHQVPPYRSNPTQPIPKANPTQQSNFMRICSLLYQISALDQPLEGFTKVEESYFIYENVKVLDGDGNVEGILNGKAKGGAYLNITYEEAKGGINTIISFFEDTASHTFVIFINGEACTVTLG